MVRVLVESIEASGLTVTFDLATTWAVAVATTALETSPLALGGSVGLTRAGTRVDAHCTAHATGTRACERCGEDAVLEVPVDVELFYVPRPVGAEPEVELAEPDLDVGWYDEAALVIDDVVSEALALALPARVVCADVEACDVRTAALLTSARAASEGASPFAALKKLLIT